MELMEYLQNYQESISHDAAGMLPNKNKIVDPDAADQEELTLTADDIWPRIQAGPNKG